MISEKEFTIVLADDDDGHAHLIEVNLKRTMCSVNIIRARDGSEAIDSINSLLQDHSTLNQIVLLLDIRMPVMDGFEALCALRKNPQFSKVPIIMLSTTDDPREIDRCYESGCNAFITKPIQPNEFMHAISTLAAFLCLMGLPRSEDSSKKNN